MRALRPSPLAFALTLAIGASARAAWSPPERVGRPDPRLSSPTLTFTEDGDGLLTASRRFLRETEIAMLPAGGGTARSRAPTAGDLRPAESFAPRWTVVAKRRFIRLDRRQNYVVRLSVSVGTPTFPVSSSFPVDVYADGGLLDLQTNARGDAVALWTAVRPGHGVVTRVASRRRGGAFTRPRTIAVLRRNGSRGSLGQAVAIGPDRRILVALTRTRATRARGVQERRIVLAPLSSGGRLGRGEVVGRHLGNDRTAAHLAIAPTGRAVLVWSTQDDWGAKPQEVWATIREPGEARFGFAQQLEGGGAKWYGGPLDLDVGADGSAVAMWASPLRRYPNPYQVVVASAPPGGRFRTSQVVSPNGIPGDIAVAPDGRATVTWTSTDDRGESFQVFAAQRLSATASFGDSDPVSAVDGSLEPVVAYDPMSGGPVVAWIGPSGPDADGIGRDLVLFVSRFR